MIKETITYEDFNGEKHTEDFWFHLDRADLLEMHAMRKGGMREYMMDIVKSDDKLEILRIFRMFIMKSVGRRSDDGRRFDRNDEIRAEFEQTGAYEEFLFYLANNADAAAVFLDNLMPASIMTQVREVMAAEAEGTAPADTSTGEAELLQQPEVVKEWHDYSREELIAMSDDEFTKMFNAVKTPKPALLLSVAMQRKN